MKTSQILVVDAEETMSESLAARLRADGYLVDTASSGRAAAEMARAREYDICFIDLQMPGSANGIETMRQIGRIHPDASVVILTTSAALDGAITAVQEGAPEYLLKPYNPREISLRVDRILRCRSLQRENSVLRKKLSRQYSFHDVIAKSPRMQAVISLAHEIASLRSTVLIHGESGTGKEIVARAIHYSGARASQPFVKVSCAGRSEMLLECELFGYEAGAFADARERRNGKLETAEGGTLFLDEVNGMPLRLQGELLRALQERRFRRLGGNEDNPVECRVMAATDVNLQQAAAEGQFREDLFYRLNVIEVRIPPLRERREDIPLLACHFIERLSRELGREVAESSADALRILMEYNWPGNVRELENTLERAIMTCRGRILTEENFEFLATNGTRRPWSVPAGITLQEMEKHVITATLAQTEGNIKEAAGILGIDRSTLYDKIKRYAIPR
jgi:DNA-binding NtrC family response regulator